jgi:hypothetical protein
MDDLTILAAGCGLSLLFGICAGALIESWLTTPKRTTPKRDSKGRFTK